MKKRNYILDIENALKGRKKPIELLNIILGFLDFKTTEIKIYNLLLKSSLTIKQIEKQDKVQKILDEITKVLEKNVVFF